MTRSRLAAALVAPVLLIACANVLGIDEYEVFDCVRSCGDATPGDADAKSDAPKDEDGSNDARDEGGADAADGKAG